VTVGSDYFGDTAVTRDGIAAVMAEVAAHRHELQSFQFSQRGISISVFELYTQPSGKTAQRVEYMVTSSVVDGEVHTFLSLFNYAEGTDMVHFSIKCDLSVVDGATVQSMIAHADNDQLNLLTLSVGVGVEVNLFEYVPNLMGEPVQRVAMTKTSFERPNGQDENGNALTEVVEQVTYFVYQMNTSLIDYTVSFENESDAGTIQEELNAIANAPELVEYELPNETITVNQYESYENPIGDIAQRVSFTRGAFLDDQSRLVQEVTCFEYIRNDSDMVYFSVHIDDSKKYSPVMGENGEEVQSLINMNEISTILDITRENIDSINDDAQAMADAENPFSFYTEKFAVFNVSISYMENYTDEYGELQQRIDYTISSSREETPRPGTTGEELFDYVMVHVTFNVYQNDHSDDVQYTVDFSNDTQTFTISHMESVVQTIQNSADPLQVSLDAGVTLTVFENYTNTLGEIQQRVKYIKSARLVSYNESTTVEETLIVYQYLNDNTSLIDFTVSFSNLYGGWIPYDSLDSIMSSVASGGGLSMPGTISYYETYTNTQGDVLQRVSNSTSYRYETLNGQQTLTSSVTTNTYADDSSDVLATSVTTYAHNNRTETTHYESYTNMWGDKRARVSQVDVVDPDNATTSTTHYYYHNPYLTLIDYTETTSSNSVTHTTSTVTSTYGTYTDYAGREQQRVVFSVSTDTSYNADDGVWETSTTETSYTYLSAHSSLISGTASYTVSGDTESTTTSSYEVYYDSIGTMKTRVSSSTTFSSSPDGSSTTYSTYHYFYANDDIVSEVTFTGSNAQGTFSGYSTYTLMADLDMSYKSYTHQDMTYNFITDDGHHATGYGYTDTTYDRWGRVLTMTNYVHYEYSYTVTSNDQPRY